MNITWGRTVQVEFPFDEWLGKQEFGTLLTRGKREWLDKEQQERW